MTKGHLPVDPDAIDIVDDDENDVGGNLIWVRDGYLDAFKFSWFVGQPVAWPRREHLRLRQRPASNSPAAWS